MSIIIKELFSSDNILTLSEKINFNFDQLILAGGGPEGPIGETGNDGVSGPGGIRGSQWFGATGVTGTTNTPTDGIFRENDFKLNINGDVAYYNNSIWNLSGINLTGPIGPKGDIGNGAISILKGEKQGNPDWGNRNEWSPNYTQMANFISGASDDDLDDYASTPGSFIDSGLDFIGVGRGNNSLVLGRYATMFRNASSDVDQEHSPQVLPDPNNTMKNFPVLEENVPMLIVSQNDYKNPDDSTGVESFKNGIAIGLTKTHEKGTYVGSNLYKTEAMDYSYFTQMSIMNRWMDFGITSFGTITLSGVSGASSFRLGTNEDRVGKDNDIHDMSTRLNSPIYTEFNITGNYLVNLVGDAGMITKDKYSYTENKQVTSQDENNDLIKSASHSFITSDLYAKNQGNEIILSNKTYLDTSDGPSANDIDKIELDISLMTTFDSNQSTQEYRIGQLVINARKSNDDSEANIHLNYQGFGYDPAFVSYSGIDETRGGGTNDINTINSTLEGVLPNDTILENYLGYDIKDPISFKKGSRSVSRLGLYPGIFRKEKIDGTNNYDDALDPDSTNRKNKFFDTSHKMLPTGSLDLFGTVRLRQQETTDDGSQDGFVAINKKDGIVTFEEPNLVNAVPTYSIQMFGEHASDKFSFYTKSGKEVGGTSDLGGYLPVSSGICATFIGKGSDELKDYYICNGAVLADSRDILTSGPFANMKGMNVETTDTFIENGEVGDGSTFDYTINTDFIGKNGETHSDWQVGGADLSIRQKQNLNVQDRIKAKWGYSILAPNEADSGFRIVLPNYFGKVAKMVFPDSEFIVRATAGLWGEVGEENAVSKHNYDLGYKFYTDSGFYNSAWMMNGSFDSLGTPYLNGSHMPRLNTNDGGIHNHTINDPEHFHTFQIDGGNDPTFGGNSIASGSSFNPTRFTDSKATGVTVNDGEGNHEHSVNYWKELKNDISTTYSLGEWYGEDNSGDYNINSNWISDSGSTRGQKFITPPFKGTYMAINLKGVRNHLRDSTLVKDFHHIAGVPVARSERDGSGNAIDMSWVSILGVPGNVNDEKIWSGTGYIYGQIHTTDDNVPLTYKLNAYENGFTQMGRQEDTMHPYTRFDSNDTEYTVPLDYQNDVYYGGTITSSWNMYKTNINKKYSGWQNVQS